MPGRKVDFLLIGGGVAAASCARTLREQGADGSILLVGREPDPPYERPPLSKQYLAGEAERGDALVLDDDWWEANDVELLTRTSVMKLDTGTRTARLSTKDEVEFGKALIATGANVRRLRVDGSDLEGIHYLRAFGNADAIRDDARGAGSVVLIGGSYIACELAATLTGLGIECAMLMQEDAPLERHFGPGVARFVAQRLEDHGVRLYGGDELERFEGSNGRVGRVRSKNGVTLDCGAVVMGTGVAPDAMLAKGAGLDLGASGGVKCSATLETSAPGVFAAGDAAEWDSPLHRAPARVEHFEVAKAHGATAAHNMLGGDRAHEEVPYFWTDLSDWASFEYVGIGTGPDVVVRGSLDDGDFTAFYLDDGRVAGALTSGRSDDLGHARRLISGRVATDRARLADERTALDEL